jgi:hypothetical protein
MSDDDWRQLEKISDHYNLDTSKATVGIASATPSDQITQLEQRPGKHAHFINHKSLTSAPALDCRGSAQHCRNSLVHIVAFVKRSAKPSKLM